jgi:hypothetical protein
MPYRCPTQRPTVRALPSVRPIRRTPRIGHCVLWLCFNTISHKIDLPALITTTVSAAYTQLLLERIPMRTSSQSGRLCTTVRSYCLRTRDAALRFRACQRRYLLPCDWTRGKGLLADSNRWVSVEEQIAMFLAVATRNGSSWATQKRFQHSGETVHRYSTRPGFAIAKHQIPPKNHCLGREVSQSESVLGPEGRLR